MALTVAQKGSQLRLTLTTGTGLDITSLTLRDADRTHLPVADTVPAPSDKAADKASDKAADKPSDSARRTVTATVDLADLASRLGPAPAAEATLEMRVTSGQERPPRFAELDTSAQKTSRPGTITYLALLGKFHHTETSGLEPVSLPDGRTAALRISREGHLVLTVGTEPPAADAQVGADFITIADGTLHVRGRIDSGSGPVAQARLVLAGRGVPIEATGPAEFTPDPAATPEKRGRWQYDFHGSVDLRDLVRSLTDQNYTLPPHSVADLWLEVTPAHGGQARLRRVGRVPVEQRFLVEESTVVVGDIALEAIPYFTSKARNIALALEQFPADAYEQLAQPRTARKPHNARKPHSARTPQDTARNTPEATPRPIWIVGERPHTAQDNGYHLFHYLRTERRDIDAYYVITADSPDRAKLEGLGNVITFGSREHMDLIVRASRIVGTHHPYYLYPSRSKRMAKAITAPQVFLQHGVMAMKWTAHTYGKFGTDFRTDMFCVSSERERELIVGDFGYRPGEVAVTGLARFDALFTHDVTLAPKQVLIAPTWRDYLANDEVFAESDYLRSWKALIESPRMRELRDSGAEVVLYLHTLMQRYADYFTDAPVTFVKQGEVDLQTLIKQSAVMITDYSSPAFDFSFLGKPVLFFQFDREQFYGSTGAHIDVDEELPGFVSDRPEAVLDRLATTLQPGFELEEEYRQRAAKFLTHPGPGNAARIATAIEALEPRRTLADRIQQQRGLRLAGLKFRKSRAYFRVMRLAYRAMKLLPMDKRTIIFETDVGKRYSDSPRAIYEELVRRGDPRRRIWIYDHTPPLLDPGRIVIKRYSPRYFYHLARAKYWVSNQNLPYYITRRRRGVYLQTWHGTPLKKMQNDLAQIVGRDDGYLGRVTKAAAQWTALISPSPYATAAFRSAFRYDRAVLETGYPRNDVLAGPGAAARRTEIRARLGLREDQRVVLYAPTFRDDQKVGNNFTFTMPFDLARFASENPDTVLLLRMHRLIATSLTIPRELEESVRDLSGYGEIADLYLAADCLIADYSSVIFDYAITGKPILFFPYDLGRYRDDVRGFYLDYEAEMPGPIALTEEELYAAVRESADPTTEAELRKRVSAFAERFAPWDDGHAAERVVDQVFGKRR